MNGQYCINNNLIPEYISSLDNKSNNAIDQSFFDLFGGVLGKEDAGLVASIEPTPINPNRVVPVAKVPIQATFWNPSDICYDSLQDIAVSSSSPAAFASTTATPISMTSNHSALLKPYSRHESTASVVSDSYSGDEATESSNSFRLSQVELWNKRYDELVAFHAEHKHCLVPLRYDKNPSLSHWVKRQRYQYRVKQEGQHSTLNDERQAALEKLGFVWDSHAGAWSERWYELQAYRDIHGHCNVPKTYKGNRQLAIWVKSQRRHYRLFEQGRKSTMTKERIMKLLHLGFDFHPRSRV